MRDALARNAMRANIALGRMWARWRPQCFPNAPRDRWEGYPEVGIAMDHLPQQHDYVNVEPFYDEVAPDPIYENDRAEEFFDATMCKEKDYSLR
jgi:hypothetical protein